MTKTLVALLMGLTLPATAIADTIKPSQNDVSPRIIGGEVAKSSEWKFIASLVLKGWPTSRGHFCGGSFLGGKYILTAAHCVEDLNADDIDIILGLYNKNRESQAQRISVNNIYSHTAYDKDTHNNDIALIELTHNVNSAAIDLATPDVLNGVRRGDQLHIAGWGDISPTTDIVFPTVLQQVDVEYVDRTTCQNLGGDYTNVSDNSICAGYAQGGKDSCHGDSGGPLIADDNGINKLLGVVSWGIGCAQPDAYGVYANVAHFQDNGWIDSHRNTISYTWLRDLHLVERTAQQETFAIRNDDTIPFNVTDSRVSAGLTMTENTCNTTLLPSQSCQITVGYAPDYSGSLETIELSTTHPKLPTLTTTLKYQGVDKVNRSLRNAIPLADANVYTNEYAWTAENGELHSADLGVSAGSSILYLTDLPKGRLTMERRAISDENDTFTIFVNGQVYETNTQVLDYEKINIDLYKTSNTIALVYIKNPSSNGMYRAQASIRNITMSPDADNTRSGGSLSIGLLMLLAAGSFVRRKKRTMR